MSAICCNSVCRPSLIRSPTPGAPTHVAMLLHTAALLISENTCSQEGGYLYPRNVLPVTMQRLQKMMTTPINSNRNQKEKQGRICRMVAQLKTLQFLTDTFLSSFLFLSASPLGECSRILAGALTVTFPS